MKRRWLVAVIALVLLAAFAWFRPDRAARVAAGLTARSLCSARFVSQQPVDATFRSLVTLLVGDTAARLISYDVDERTRRVTARFAGTISATASFTPGFGCRIDRSENRTLPHYTGPEAHGLPAPFPVSIDPLLFPAVDRLFGERPGQPMKRILALVVLRNGKIVAERYAPGTSERTPLLGFSVAKSVTNALAGILVRQGRLRRDQHGIAPEWQDAQDPRRRITVEDLLRMRSGLDAPENGASSDPINRMLYDSADMAGFAAHRPLRGSPGTEWDYSSANTLLLTRLIGRIVGGGPAGLRRFAEHELFAPLGISDVTMEVDGAGNFIGSSYFYAPARSFARLGQLYLEDGMSADGRRILPQGWAAWSRTSTLGRGYGAGFWTNDGPSAPARARIAAGFPADGYFASGNLGQRIYIVPSAKVVIARFGYSTPPDLGLDDDLALIAAAVRLPRQAERRVGSGRAAAPERPTSPRNHAGPA